MFVYSFFPFSPYCDSVIKYDSCSSTVSNDSSEYSVGENNMLCETGETSATESSNIPMLDSGFFGNKSVTWFDFVGGMDKDGSLEYYRMSAESGTAEGSVSVSDSKILVYLENGKA